MKIRNKEINRDIIISLIYGSGGAIGGYGNALQINAIPFNSIILGLISAFILGSVLEYKFKKNFSLRFCFAIALTGGLCSSVIIKSVRDMVTLPIRNYQLEQTIAIEQQKNIENNKAIALATNDPEIKKKAIKNISQVGERSSQKTESIEAIESIAVDSNPIVKQAAIEELTVIVEDSKEKTEINEATEAIASTSENIEDYRLVLNALRELQQSAIDAETEEKRKQIIFAMADYKGHHGEELDLWLGAMINYLSDIGKNDYLIFNEELKMLERKKLSG